MDSINDALALAVVAVQTAKNTHAYYTSRVAHILRLITDNATKTSQIVDSTPGRSRGKSKQQRRAQLRLRTLDLKGRNYSERLFTCQALRDAYAEQYDVALIRLITITEYQKSRRPLPAGDMPGSDALDRLLVAPASVVALEQLLAAKIMPAAE
jgi:hypothetical protein